MTEKDEALKEWEAQRHLPSPKFDEETLKILREAAENSKIMEVKYRRAKRELAAMEDARTRLLEVEDQLNSFKAKVHLLEQVEQRCFLLEEEVERLNRSQSCEKALQDTTSTIEALNEEFEALNESNNALINRQIGLERENKDLRNCKDSLLERISELESINVTLESVIKSNKKYIV